MKHNNPTTSAILYNNKIGLGALIFVLITFVVFLHVNYFVIFDQTIGTHAPVPEVQSNKEVNAILSPLQTNLTIDRSDSSEFTVQAVRKPYRFDKACTNFTKRLYRAGSFNLTALVSFPGSGNTWTRHLIELSTGVYTGSIYFDFELIAKGFLGEKESWTSGTTVVQKTHEKYTQNSLFTKAILLVRDPYKTIVSFVQYLEVGHTAASSGHIFHKEGWENYTLGETYKWISLIKSWAEAPIPILIVQYEHLNEKPNAHLMSLICNFLSVPCRYINSSCFKRHQEGEFHRKRKLPVVPPFPLWVRHKIDDGIDYLNNLLHLTRGESLPLSLYPYYRNYSGL